MVVLPEGTEITCPKCGKVLFRSKRDLSAGDVIRFQDFEATPGIPQPERRTDMVCPFDREPYGKRLLGVAMVHTRRGWI